MLKQFEYVVFIGRFQPSHRGHINTILKGLEISKNVIVIIGSSFRPRSPENPWSYEERRELIQMALSEHLDLKDMNRVLFSYSYDFKYNEQKWIEDIQTKVKSHVPSPKAKIAIIGHHKDESSYYLDKFPQWDFVEMENTELLNATDIRDIYFSKEFTGFSEKIINDLSRPIVGYLEAFMKTTQYTDVCNYTAYVKRYHKDWEPAPYIPTFVTTDAVVICSGHVLLVKRRVDPGKGNWAVPGGFLDPDQRIIDSMIRELQEETKIKIPEKVLRGSIKDKHEFDHPQRSLRGRTVTHAYLLEVAPDNDGSLPTVKGSDDAEKAKWFPISDIDFIRDRLFEDHADIITYFVARL